MARVVSSCLAGFELKNSLRCVPTTTVIPNCAKFLDTGVCQSCNAGFVLVDTTESDDAQNLTSDSLDRSDLLIYRCIPVVTGCTNYDGTTQKCK